MVPPEPRIAPQESTMASQESMLDLRLKTFLERLGSDAPAPGGGAAAALCGALAASLGSMVCAFTIGKPKFAAVEAESRELSAHFQRAAEVFARWVDEDAAAYAALSAARKLPKDDPARAAEVASSAALAAVVPLETASLADRLLFDFKRLHAIGNPALGSDVEAGAQLARACKQAALANVRANLPFLEAQFRQRMQNELARLERSHVE